MDQLSHSEFLNWPEERLRLLAHRMLRRFPKVRRWDETDDILQEAAIRLYRALHQVTPESQVHWHRLAIMQIRRVLLDLSRHYAAQSSFATHHDTSHDLSFEDRIKGRCGDPDDQPDHIESWTRLHEKAEELPEPLKEAFDLCWYEGLKPLQAAELLGKPERTTYRHFRDAKRWLARQLKDEIPMLDGR